MTDALIVSIVHDVILIIPPTLVGVVGWLQGKKNHKQGTKIVQLTDGNLIRLTAKQEASEREVDALKQLVRSLTNKQGVPGVKGDTGDTGETGDTGPQGEQGERGR